MSITFRCEHCGREAEVPADSAGKRSPCPHCHQTNYIPVPAEQRDVIPLEDLDDSEEVLRQEEIQRLHQVERELLAGETGELPIPLEHRENLSVADLHHLVINYFLDLAGGRLDRAGMHVDKLRKFGSLASDAVADLASGKVAEPALKAIPAPVLKGFCRQLQVELAAKK
ncbi:MAG: hypothetical protein NT031_03900 [Planctomycetota bacterium]|nr:hypothetical protein [Planctomycetota bacterium]